MADASRLLDCSTARLDVVAGNAGRDGPAWRGWVVGHFVELPDDPRATDDVEVKWAVHAAGEERAGWAVNQTARSITFLVRGRFRFVFPDREVLLAELGDYVAWPPGVPHRWVSEEDSIVLTVRWPSRVDDSVEVEAPVSRAHGEPERA